MINQLEYSQSDLFSLNARPTVFTEKEIISALKGITEHRFKALSAYPNWKHFNESIGLVNYLRDELNNAELQLNYKSAVKICLRLENPLLYLAPRSTVKIFNTYKAKVDFLMEACRIILTYKAPVS